MSAVPRQQVNDAINCGDGNMQRVFTNQGERHFGNRIQPLLGGNRSKLTGVVLSEVAEDTSMEGTGVLAALIGRQADNFGFEQPPRRAA